MRDDEVLQNIDGSEEQFERNALMRGMFEYPAEAKQQQAK